MANNSNKNDGPAEVQVFELTMDNDEDQDELNRRLKKPGERNPSQPVEGAGQSADSRTIAPRQETTDATDRARQEEQNGDI